MNKHQIAFLKSIGFTKAMIDALIATKEEDTTVDLSTYLTAFRESQLQLHENDPDLVSKIETAATGKINNIASRDIIKTFNLPPELTKDKTTKELIALAKETSAKGVEKPILELQTENATLHAKIKEYEDVIIPGEKTKVVSEINALKKDNLIDKFLAGKELRVPLKTAKAALLAEMGENYDNEISEDGKEIKLFGKGSKLHAKTKDGTGLLSFDNFLTGVLTENKLLKESNADDINNNNKKKPATVLTDEQKAAREKDLKTKPHLNAASQHLENIKKQNEANRLADEASQKKMAGKTE